MCKLVLISCLLLGLIGCGATGDLYLPKEGQSKVLKKHKDAHE